MYEAWHMANDRDLKQYEHELSSERDAVQFTEEFSLFVLRSCVVLNGGAILAILSLLGTLVSHPESLIVVSFVYVRVALSMFAAGLVTTVIAGVCGYHNFLLGQARNLQGPSLATNLRSMKWARRWGTTFAILAVVLFVVGVIVVIVAIGEKQT
jgi:hypothetical protein